MTTLKKAAAALGIASLAGVGLYEAAVIRRQRAEFSRFDGQVSALRAEVERTRAQPMRPAASKAPDPAATPNAFIVAASPDQRVALLQQLLDELPAQRLPELKLLTLVDWIEIARTHELDTAADIRVALADLRAVARKKFAATLQEALRRFTAASDGQLPTDIAQLAAYLSAPADAEMLARYDLVRTGKLGDPSEKLLREKPTSDMLLSVGLDGWGMNNNSELPAAFGETESDALERTWRALGTALGDEAKEKMATMASPRVMSDLMEGIVRNLAPIYGDSEAVGDVMKQAARNFLAAHPGEIVTDVAQVLPFLRDSEQFIAALRPAFAQLAYIRDHAGQPPSDPAALQPYLSRPFDAAMALREMKLKWDGEHLTMSYNWTK